MDREKAAETRFIEFFENMDSSFRSNAEFTFTEYLCVTVGLGPVAAAALGALSSGWS